ncbi:MAG TPA: serine/threonine-protein kinase [Candidatus Glassbacteria bacterium]|nr:serine/threonine-protein kinase [Candidatus Glassbacteria bacterium]
MKIIVKGKTISLNKSDFCGSGGEGSIYSKNKIAYKIYTDVSRMIPIGKIQELSRLSHPNIVKPIDSIEDGKRPVGYTMQFVPASSALCQIFTKAFRDRNNISPTMTNGLIEKLKDIVDHAHKNKILIVDLNEMNFLVTKDFDDLYAIDVDSWQTPSYPATAIMDSIRDRHSKTFSEVTDWFSFGIVSFQMFVGIHPYKGKHSQIKSWDERMLKNISVFNKDVSIPKACYPLTAIPPAYMDWYKAVFDDGKRLPPPTSFQASVHIIPVVKVIAGNDLFDIKELEDFGSTIINVFIYKGHQAVLTSDGNCHITNKTVPVLQGTKIIISQRGTIIGASIDNNMLSLKDIGREKEIPCSIQTEAILKYNNRIYIKNNGKIYELFLNEGAIIIPSLKPVGNVTHNSSQFTDGVVIQNLLGSYYVSVFPDSGNGYQVSIKELNGYRIIDAKFDSGVLVIGAEKKSKYYVFKIKFAPDYSVYDLKVEPDVQNIDINFTVLDNGVCVLINQNDELEMFHSKHTSTSGKVIQNQLIGNDMRLYSNGSRLLFAKGSKLYSMSMK